jgi:hypothetical protein
LKFGALKRKAGLKACTADESGRGVGAVIKSEWCEERGLTLAGFVVSQKFWYVTGDLIMVIQRFSPHWPGAGVAQKVKGRQT